MSIITTLHRSLWSIFETSLITWLTILKKVVIMVKDKSKDKKKTKKKSEEKTTKKIAAKAKPKSKLKQDLVASDDAGIIVVEDDPNMDKDAELEARRAYLEEARSQEAED